MIKRSYNLTAVMGIPIRVHLTLVILLLFVAFTRGLSGVLIAVGVFASVALHELGHSWVAIRKGCQVREIMLLPIGGVAKMSHIPSRPRDEFLIAAAGPLASFLLAVLFWLLTATGGFTQFFINLFVINLMLCLFNLLPSFPMDGGRIFRAFMTPRLGRLKATALAARIGRIMAVAFGIFGLFNGNFILILIAIFIYNAAGAEYRAVYAQHMSQEWFTVEPQADIHVSPPPYAHKAPPFWKKWKKNTNAFFNDLFKNWE
ncbi:MAG: site-2 protease family protein [Kiritimatiellales bacterium]|nr:site-2 protease family protein [Kiritimatiellota bacterium]MBL7011498.1 site-2 protease family protein [Kiritimatiellales bacterium]